jgi:hypothetical protein
MELRQLIPRQRFSSLIPCLGLFRDLFRCGFVTGSRVHRHCLRQIWALLRNPYFLRHLLRLFHFDIRPIANAECHSQCRFGSGNNHRATNRSAVAAQYRAVHLRRLDQSYGMAVRVRFHSQLSGTGMDHLQF